MILERSPSSPTARWTWRRWPVSCHSPVYRVGELLVDSPPQPSGGNAHVLTENPWIVASSRRRRRAFANPTTISPAACPWLPRCRPKQVTDGSMGIIAG